MAGNPPLSLGLPPSNPVSSPAGPPAKPRSCVVCRSRKVRCDKRLPCSNCRRANIACVAASSDDRPPRWARRLERLAAAPAQQTQEADPATAQVMDRLRSLEHLVKELGGQLQAAHAGNGGGGTSASSSPSAAATSPDAAAGHAGSTTSALDAASRPSPGTSSVQKNFGRLVVRDGAPSQYVGSGFWSRVSDELDALKNDSQGLPNADSDASDDDNEFSGDGTNTTRESHRPGADRNGLLFGHNLLGQPAGGVDLAAFRPLPSQVPFLVSVFGENVNFAFQIVHMPALERLARDARSTPPRPPVSPSDEALLFAVYYAAVTSMEDADVLASFGASKMDLNYRFRLGLEHALARADFVRLPDLALVQAFSIFLCLARRHDSPRYVWMMAGLAIRMSQAIGLHRDAARLSHISPYDAEIRRRVWWALMLLDIRASEDQGTEFTIAPGSFDTRMPISINDADLYPSMTEPPTARDGDTDMVFAVGSYHTCRYSRLIMAARMPDGTPDVAEQSRLLDSFRNVLDLLGAARGQPMAFGDLGEVREAAFWVAVNVTRLVISKLALFIHLPSLFSADAAATSMAEDSSAQTRNRLLVAALEVAEYNHALSAEPACVRWRWIMQTYTHWHAIVLLLIEATRRPWSPLIERAWVALHSRWLIPAQPRSDRGARVWIPLRRLMARARRHRDAELRRLAADPVAAEETRALDAAVPVPGSAGLFGGGGEDVLVAHWYALIRGAGAIPAQPASWTIPPSQAQGPVSESVAFSGPDFSSGAWESVDAALDEDFGDLDMDISMGDRVDWNDWLNSAAVMECPGMEGQGEGAGAG